MSQQGTPSASKMESWFYWGSWGIAMGVLAFAVYLGWQTYWTPRTSPAPALAAISPVLNEPVESVDVGVALPELRNDNAILSISRKTSQHTIVPNRPRQEVTIYQVQTGDSVFAIARSFGITPESVLWGNYDLLNDNPDMLTLDMQLRIPPTDGVLYEWKEGDTIEGVAVAYKARSEDIINWPGNNLDLIDPQINPGTLIMIPGGQREFRQWLVPTIPRGAAGVSRDVLGGGACPGGYDGAFGTGSFVWPADNRYVVGNDYWSGHLGIDIGAGMGAPIYAADSGVVVFAGPAFGGYGNMIMIDHGNGYQTLYAHLSVVSSRCGQSVSKGQTIGFSGSTGRSTGPHLHFEVRYLGGFVNPWFVLP